MEAPLGTKGINCSRRRPSKNESRDAAIAAAYRTGKYSLASLGQRYEVSRQRIHQICARLTDST